MCNLIGIHKFLCGYVANWTKLFAQKLPHPLIFLALGLGMSCPMIYRNTFYINLPTSKNEVEVIIIFNLVLPSTHCTEASGKEDWTLMCNLDMITNSVPVVTFTSTATILLFPIAGMLWFTSWPELRDSLWPDPVYSSLVQDILLDPLTTQVNTTISSTKAIWTPGMSSYNTPEVIQVQIIIRFSIVMCAGITRIMRKGRGESDWPHVGNIILITVLANSYEVYKRINEKLLLHFE